MRELRLRLIGTDLSAVTPELEYQAARHAGAPVDLRLDPRDQEELRWFWEDLSVDFYKPGYGRRQRAEEAVTRIGEALGRAFASTEQTRRLLDRALTAAEKPLVLISANSDALLSLPWELARTLGGKELESLVAGVARRRENAGLPPEEPRGGTGPLRVLLVVSRPQAEDDIAYQAIAAKLLDRLEGRAEVKLVRPGTFPAFERMVDRGPWDLVHYDGHGSASQLAFEDGGVEAERIGRLLARSGVSVFALNACRSAVGEARQGWSGREVGSVARALVDAGAVGVVAMGANVRVGSAIAFFDRFYEELARGETLSIACRRARRAIEAGRGQGPLDWAIPVLYLQEDSAPFRGRALPADPGAAGAEDAPDKEPQGVFVGRDGDLYVLDRAIDQYPRVLLFGPGGVGKTTVVEYLLRWRRRTGGADRVLSFSFRYAPSLESLAQALQEQVENARPDAVARFRTPQWASTSLGERLSGLARVLTRDTETTRLFLFDNLETLAGYPEVGSGPYTEEDRSIFRTLVAALEGGGTRVVMTSRRDEIEMLDDKVRRFPLHGVTGRHRLEMLLEYSEVYAAARGSREAIAAEKPEPVVEQLLEELGGHPLATRVAAYGLQDRGLADVLASIRGQAERIRIPASQANARSASMEAAFAGALEALSEARRQALGILGLFAGRFHESDLLALVLHEQFPDGVMGERTEVALRQVLFEARQLGLIIQAKEPEKVWDVVPGIQGTLETLWREGAGPSTSAALEGHFVRYWAGAAAFYQAVLHSEERPRWVVERAGINEGTLHKALAWAAQASDWNAAGAILRWLLELWPIHGRLKEADHLRDQWLKRVSSSEGRPLELENPGLVRLWGHLRGRLADREAQQGRLEAAHGIYREVIEVLETMEGEVRSDLARDYHQLGRIAQQRGRLEDAEAWHGKSLEIDEELGNRSGRAANYYQLGQIEQARGERDTAEEWYRQAREIYAAEGDRPQLARVFHQLGLVAEERERWDEAKKFFDESLDIYEGLKDALGLASSHFQLGRIEQAQGNLDAADERYHRAQKIYEEQEDRPGKAMVYRQFGMVERDRGRLDTAESWFQKGKEFGESPRDRPDAASGPRQPGKTQDDGGRLAATEAWYEKGREADEELWNRQGMASGYQQLGLLLRQRGEHRAALRVTLKALTLFTDLKLPDAGKSWNSLKALHDEVGRDAFQQLWRDEKAPLRLLEQTLQEFALPGTESYDPTVPGMPGEGSVSQSTS